MPSTTQAEPSAERALWPDTFPEHERCRSSALDRDVDVDVAIVGGGLTGLWTAWYLAQHDPSMRIVVLEREVVGFGASGRNGGWCSALLPMSHDRLVARHGRAAARRMQRAMYDNVADIERLVGRLAASTPGPSIVDLDSVFHRGGTIQLARTRPQVDRLTAHLADMRELGATDDDERWLDADAATSVCGATGVLGAVMTPHCATIHPLRFTHLVARAAQAAGVQIHERTTVEAIERHRVRTDRGIVRAEVLVRATEGYTAQLPGERRTLLPIYSLMIATEPLDASTWERIGLDDRPTFSDARRLVIYGQRTADGRLAFGGRGAPYHFGSAIRPQFDTDQRVRRHLADTLRDLFPVLDDVPVTHHWGGVLAAPRDWTSGVQFDRRAGLASAGGYVGDGVATTHLAGRTLAALVTGTDDDVVRLPWVGHRSRRWEPEPLRWLGVNLARTAVTRADAVELETGRSSRWWDGLASALMRH